MSSKLGMTTEWVRCPICGNKTRLQIRKDTELKNFPLYALKSPHEWSAAERCAGASKAKGLRTYLAYGLIFLLIWFNTCTKNIKPETCMGIYFG